MALASIWIALRAKPLGVLPYRWGTYCVIETGLVGVSLSLATVNVQNWNAFTLFVMLWGSASLHAAIGLFRRRRYGVVFLILSELITFLGDPIRAAFGLPGVGQPGSGLPLPVVLIANIVYFKKRWKAMGMAPSTVSAPIVEMQ